MATTVKNESAKIYIFPTRAELAAREAERRANDPANAYAHVAFGGSWYHDDAIKEDRVSAERGR